MTKYNTIEESMNDGKPWRDKELMEEMYLDRLMSQQEIATNFDDEITQAGVGYCLAALGIEKRTRSEAAMVKWAKLRDPKHLRRLADEIEDALEEQ